MINVSYWSIKNPIPAVMLFVMLCFAFGQSNFAFDASIFPMQVQGHQGIAFLLHLANQATNFFFVQQQFS